LQRLLDHRQVSQSLSEQAPEDGLRIGVIGMEVAAVCYHDVADCLQELESAVDVVVEPT